MQPLLLTLWAPLVGAVLIMLLPPRALRLIRGVALAHATVSLAASWALLPRFDRASAAVQFGAVFPWDPPASTTYALGVDGLSFPLVLLTTLLAWVAILASMTVQHRVKGYFAWFLLLEFGIVGVFEVQNWSFFYVFWEVTLVPLFVLISVWGGKNRNVASMSFFLYTLAGSIFMLIALLAVYIFSPSHSFGMAEMARAHTGWTREFQLFAFLGFFLGFAVKIPAFPLHGWLSYAHVEAPTPVSIMLSGILLKMGGYGLMRAAVLLPQGVRAFLPVLVGIALVNIVYGALLAWRQRDLKAMVAYSSINHMGFVLLGVASLNYTGFVGAAAQMVTHGVVTGALFLLVGALYERTHTRDLADYGGLARVVPGFAVVTSVAMLGSMGVPGLAGFVSELHAMMGGYQRFSYLVALASLGVLLTASYSLRALGKLFMGPLNPRWAYLSDLSAREVLAVAPLGVLMVALGALPRALLDLVGATIANMTRQF